MSAQPTHYRPMRSEERVPLGQANGGLDPRSLWQAIYRWCRMQYQGAGYADHLGVFRPQLVYAKGHFVEAYRAVEARYPQPDRWRNGLRWANKVRVYPIP